MNLAEKEMLLNQIEHKIGIIRTFHKEEDGVNELIEVYEDMVKNGTSTLEAKTFQDDLDLFLETSKGEVK